MREIMKRIYTFDELSDEAKEIAIEKNRYFNVDNTSWSEFVIEDFCRKCAEYGIDVDEKDVSFTGFWSQGDGASFVGEVDNTELFLQRIGVDLPKDISERLIVRFSRIGWRYSHEYTCTTEYEQNFDCDEEIEVEEKYSEQLNSIYEKAEVLRVELCRTLYNTLEQSYCELTSDESIAETMIANECEFYEDGSDYL